MIISRSGRRSPFPDKGRWIQVLLLGLLFAQAVTAAARLSLTSDEGSHITSGYTILRTGDMRLVEEHPPLVKVISAWPTLLVPDLPDPTTLPGWESDLPATESARLGQATKALVYEYHSMDLLVFSTRVPIALLAVFLGAVTARWATDLWGWKGGSLALLLLVFDPNILAQASLTTIDLGATCFITLALFCLARFLRRPTRSRLVLAGVSLGLAQASKISALALVPIFGLLCLLMLRQRRLIYTALIMLIAALTLWAAFGFEIQPIPGVPFPVPAASYRIPFLRLQQHMVNGHETFLLGQNSMQGWWYYFPVAFALKTPLPTLLLLLAALAALWKGPRLALREESVLLLFPLAYGASTLVSSINIGYRHLMPILPSLFVFIARLAVFPLAQLRVRVVRMASIGLTVALLAWLAVGTLGIWPHYLAFFNEAAGGPDNGYRYLADSNTDWGQTYKYLADFERQQGINVLRLSAYLFYTPSVYGVSYEPLTPMMGNTPPIFPSRFNPPPGDYAISASALQGIPLIADHEMFDWFRKREPDAKIGHVMFVYRIPPGPARSWVAQCTTPITPLKPEDIAEGMGRSGLRLAYFDCATSWLVPTGGQSPGWAILARNAQVGDPRWLEKTRLSYEQKRSGFTPPFRIYEDAGTADWPSNQPVRVAPSEIGLADALDKPAINLPVNFGPLTLLGYTVDRANPKPGETVHLETVWRVNSVPDKLLSLMAHVLGPDGRVVAAGDGLGVLIESWQPGDVFIQRHTLTLPADAPPGAYGLETGVYWLDDGKRWAAQDSRATGDRVLLTELNSKK